MSHDTAASVAATGQRTTSSNSGISGPEPLYGGTGTGRRVTVRDIAGAKARGEKWPMLTAYDALTAGIFDRAGIPVLLVGDSAAMVVYGHDTTIPVTVDDLIPLTAAVVRGTSRALVVATACDTSAIWASSTRPFCPTASGEEHQLAMPAVPA